MKITFFLNWMGPISTKWYDYNNIPYVEETKWSNLLNKEITLKHYSKRYCCGRIDVHGIPEEHPLYCPFGCHEIGVPIMEESSWRKFGDYLDKLQLNYVPTAKQIFYLFEQDTGERIVWWKDYDQQTDN